MSIRPDLNLSFSDGTVVTLESRFLKRFPNSYFATLPVDSLETFTVELHEHDPILAKKVIEFVRSGGVPPSCETKQQAMELLHELRFFGVLPEDWDTAKTVFPFTSTRLDSTSWKSPLIWESKTLYFHQRFSGKCVFVDLRGYKNAIQDFMPPILTFDEKMMKISEKIVKDYGDIFLMNLLGDFHAEGLTVAKLKENRKKRIESSPRFEDPEEKRGTELLILFLETLENNPELAAKTTLEYFNEAVAAAKLVSEEVQSLVLLQNLLSFAPHDSIPNIIFENADKFVDKMTKEQNVLKSYVPQKFYLDFLPCAGKVYLRDDSGEPVEEIDTNPGEPLGVDVYAANRVDMVISELPFGHTLRDVEELDKEAQRRYFPSSSSGDEPISSNVKTN